MESMDSDYNVKIIAELAQAYEGSLGILHSYIDALATVGVDIIKFQVHIAEKESSKYEKFRVPFSYVDKTRFDYWKRMEFTREQWIGVKHHCDEKGVEFLASPFSLSAVELLEDLGVKRYKIASGEIDNFLMLDRIKKTGKEVLISTGMSTFTEIEETIRFFKYPESRIALFQCTTSYPTKPQEVGLNVIPELSKRFGVKVGLSDHSGEIFPSLAAVSLGAVFIECHAVFDKRMFGPDSPSSLSIDEFKLLVKGIRFIEGMLKHPVDKGDASKFQKLKAMFGKSLVVNKDLRQGQKITQNDLEDRKPRTLGIPTKHYQKVIGKILKVDIKKNSFIREEDVK